jgi:hypothetical protein
MKTNPASHSVWFPSIALAMGLITTILHYTGFGVGDHIEQIPLILRTMNPQFLSRDFFLNVSQGSMARFGYTQCIAQLAGGAFNLPLLFLFLTAAANCAIALITFQFARKRFKGSDTAGILAAAFVMSVQTFYLGWSTTIYRPTLVPTTLAIPLLLAALQAAYEKDVFLSMMCCGVAAVLHPVLGLELGALILTSAFLAECLCTRGVPKDIWRSILPGTFLIGLVAILLLLPQLAQSSIESTEFVKIMAYFRHPHHYRLSYFDPLDVVEAGAFFLGLTLLIQDQEKKGPSGERGLTAAFACLIALALLMGTLFTELLPNRLWVTAQVFRLVYFLKWLGLVLAAGWVTTHRRPPAQKNLLLAGILHPLAFGLALASQRARRVWSGKHLWAEKLLSPTTLIIPVVALVTLKPGSWNAAALLGAYLLFIQAGRYFSTSALRISLVAIMAVAILTLGLHNHLPYMNQLAPIQTLAKAANGKMDIELDPDAVDIAMFARTNTPENSLFLTPPYWGQFRLLARRAIVVDFKAFPFTDQGILAWYQRILDCYGRPKERGFDMQPELENFYYWMNDEKRLALQKTYGFTHAVLYSDTPTSLPIIYKNSHYLLIYLGDD